MINTNILLKKSSTIIQKNQPAMALLVYEVYTSIITVLESFAATESLELYDNSSNQRLSTKHFSSTLPHNSLESSEPADCGLCVSRHSITALGVRTKPDTLKRLAVPTKTCSTKVWRRD